jgi:hypothetical protein
MTNTISTPQWWVVTDLDGTLMDHQYDLVTGRTCHTSFAEGRDTSDSLHQQNRGGGDPLPT